MSVEHPWPLATVKPINPQADRVATAILDAAKSLPVQDELRHVGLCTYNWWCHVARLLKGDDIVWGNYSKAVREKFEAAMASALGQPEKTRDQIRAEAYRDIASKFREKEEAHRLSVKSPATTAKGAEVFEILANEYGACAEDLEVRAEGMR